MPDTLAVEDRIVASIRQIVRAVDLHSKRLVDTFGLTGPQLATLDAVEKLGPSAPSSIARAVHLSQGTVTGIVQRLEKRALVERSPSPTDRRSVLIGITDEGRRLLDRAPSLLQDTFREELSRLEEWERLAMLASLQRIASLMGAERIDASPYLISDAVSLENGGEPNEPPTI